MFLCDKRRFPWWKPLREQVTKDKACLTFIKACQCDEPDIASIAGAFAALRLESWGQIEPHVKAFLHCNSCSSRTTECSGICRGCAACLPTTPRMRTFPASLDPLTVAVRPCGASPTPVWWTGCSSLVAQLRQSCGVRARRPRLWRRTAASHDVRSLPRCRGPCAGVASAFSLAVHVARGDLHDAVDLEGVIAHRDTLPDELDADLEALDIDGEHFAADFDAAKRGFVLAKKKGGIEALKAASELPPGFTACESGSLPGNNLERCVIAQRPCGCAFSRVPSTRRSSAAGKMLSCAQDRG